MPWSAVFLLMSKLGYEAFKCRRGFMLVSFSMINVVKCSFVHCELQ